MNKIDFVMYHYVRELKYSRYPKIKGLDISKFKEQIKYLNKHFKIIPMEEAIEKVIVGGRFCDNAMVLTFDDGYIDNFTNVMPILKEYGLYGSFFIPGKTFTEDKLLDVNKIHFILSSGDEKEIVKDLFHYLDEYRAERPDISSNDTLYHKYAIPNRFDTKDTIFCKRILQTAIDEKIRNEISSKLFEKYVGVDEKSFARELYMNKDQIRYMKKEGMFIGIHGYDHYWLGNLKEVDMKKDVDKALEVMKEYIDQDNWVMNYPYGNYNEQVISYIKERGCKIGLTTIVGTANLDTDNIYELPRWDCNDFPPISLNYQEV